MSPTIEQTAWATMAAGEIERTIETLRGEVAEALGVPKDSPAVRTWITSMHLAHLIAAREGKK
jgi:hypothetical protein